MDTTTDVHVPANYQFMRGDIDPNLDMPDELAEEILNRLNNLLKTRLREDYQIHLSGAPGHSVAVREVGSCAPGSVPKILDVISRSENLRIQREISENHNVEGVA